MKILMVDDETILRHIFRDFFESDGHEIIDTFDATLAIELIKSQEFDLLIVDYRLKGGSGLDVVVEAKKKNISCLMISGQWTREAIKEAHDLGVETINKPFSWHSLKNKIMELVEK